MKILTTVVFLLMFKFCYKDTMLPCEKWEYWDECIPVSTDSVCTVSDSAVVGQVCGTGLEEARDGKTTLLINDPDKKVVRHYIKKL